MTLNCLSSCGTLKKTSKVIYANRAPAWISRDQIAKSHTKNPCLKFESTSTEINGIIYDLS